MNLYPGVTRQYRSRRFIIPLFSLCLTIHSKSIKQFREAHHGGAQRTADYFDPFDPTYEWPQAGNNWLVKLVAPRPSTKRNSSRVRAQARARLQARRGCGPASHRQFAQHANTQLFLIAPGNGDRVRGFRGRIKMRLGVKLKPANPTSVRERGPHVFTR